MKALSATQPFLVSSRNAGALRDDAKNGCVAETFSFLSLVTEAPGQRLCWHCCNLFIRRFGVRLRLRRSYGPALSYTIGRVWYNLVLAFEPVDECDLVEEIY